MTSGVTLPPARLQRIGLGVLFFLGALDAWRYARYQVNPDGVSYVDLALAFVREGPSALVNGYWSPLYPALIGVGYAIAPPTLDTMYLVAHVVSVLPYVFALWTFHRLLTAVRTRVTDSTHGSIIVIVGWAAFALYILKGIGLHLITPDIGVAAVVFWLAAETLDLGDGPWTTRQWVTAGTVLAMGYWWKAILFPVGLAWFGVAGLITLWRRDSRRAPAAGLAVYVALALIVIVPVSRQTGRPTFGETGRLNYLWYVNAAPYVWERCLPTGYGAAAVAPFGAIARDSLIVATPVTCTIASPLASATMPLWDDPSRYYRDAHPRADPPRQVRAVRNNLNFLVNELALLGPLLILVALGVGTANALRRARTAFRRGSDDAAEPTLPLATRLLLGTLIAAPIGFYLLVYVEFRHVAPFVVVGILAAVWAATRHFARATHAVLLAFVFVALGEMSWRLSTQTLIGMTLARATIQGRGPERVPVTHLVARELRDAGLAPGTKVASVFNAWNAEWAQLAQLRIRAHVPEWTTPLPNVLRSLRDECIRARWDAALRANGIEAAVARVVEGLPAPPTFDRIAGTEFHLHRVPTTPVPIPAGCAADAAATRSSSGTAAH